MFVYYFYRRRTKSHSNYEGNGQYICPHCNREFASGNALGGHISGAHTKKSKRTPRNSYDGHTNFNQRPPTYNVNRVAVQY